MAYPDNTDIYEHGIVSTKPVPGLMRLATTREPIYSGYNLAIVAADGSSLNHRATLVAQVPVAHWRKDFHQESDMRYCLRATLYHLNRVIDLYVEKCRLLEQIHPGRPKGEGNTSDSRIFFEADAFLGAARRAYDAISNVIWKHFVGGTGRWDSAHDAIGWMKKHPGKVSPEVAQHYNGSWDRCGAKLTDYRDYIMHHVPLTDGGETLWMDDFGGRWGATMPLPKKSGDQESGAFEPYQGHRRAQLLPRRGNGIGEAGRICDSTACRQFLYRQPPAPLEGRLRLGKGLKGRWQ